MYTSACPSSMPSSSLVSSISIVPHVCSENGYFYKQSNGLVQMGLNLTALDSQYCKSASVINTNGRLACESGTNSVNGLLGGSWSQDCSPVIVTGAQVTEEGGYADNLLVATCGMDIRRNIQASKINIGLCSSSATMSLVSTPYSGLNPVLVCSALASNNPSLPLPGGNWYNTCSPIYFGGSGINLTLVTDCGLVDSQGLRRFSALNMSLCAPGSDVNASLGALTCLSVSTTIGLPPGSWSSTCSPQSWLDGILTCIQSGALVGGQWLVVNYNLCAEGATVAVTQTTTPTYGAGRSTLTCSALDSNLPQGVWMSTCAPISWNASSQFLVAKCNRNGPEAITSGSIPDIVDFFTDLSYVDLSLCAPRTTLSVPSFSQMSAVQYSGVLICDGGLASSMPKGDWSNSCSPFSFNSTSGMLLATCRYQIKGLSDDIAQGFSSLTLVNTAMCSPGSSLSNVEGILTCSSLASSAFFPGQIEEDWSSHCAPLSNNGDVLLAICPCYKVGCKGLDASGVPIGRLAGLPMFITVDALNFVLDAKSNPSPLPDPKIYGMVE